MARRSIQRQDTALSVPDPDATHLSSLLSLHPTTHSLSPSSSSGSPSAPKMPAPHYHGHRQRLKERFLKDPAAVPDYELLELILYCVYPRRDVKPQAKALLDKHVSLGGVLHHCAGLEKGARVVLTAIGEIARRMLLQDLQTGPLLNNAQKVVEYCYTTMAHLTSEQFRLFFLDRKYHLLAEEVMQSGTLDQVALYPREVVRRCLDLNAACLILVHNHPSGDPSPSQADIDITKHLRHSLAPFSIQVLDHFIIGRRGYFSFREQGLLGGHTPPHA